MFLTKENSMISKQTITNFFDKFENVNIGDIDALKELCNDCSEVLDICYHNETWSIYNCKSLMKKYSDNNDRLSLINIVSDIQKLLSWTLNTIDNSVSLNNLPSCRDILKISDKDIALKCAKDLVQNNIISKFTSAITLTDKVGDASQINEIASFYIPIYNELNRLIDKEHWTLSPIEQNLLLRVKAELGYCYLAAIKTGIEIAQELKDLIKTEDQARNYIDKYSQSNCNFNNYSL